ncbi:hypothetical protein TRAPUB_11845 [Trametes pubescens]|uniref:Uncharacterized protein n=1 Tax=Trametes pubescens TaxID=154538 RepID=A0A1M2VKP6_TRAPU|nr:hypothetical protein TRAPUB_937 [Trametes pubescens]OJT10116.1 hypothetical protein TRAPUB_13406 [Trametes pubescens]OJT11639.1 hypothetical protein TRAPUB_11845 [Trametes pubescens]
MSRTYSASHSSQAAIQSPDPSQSRHLTAHGRTKPTAQETARGTEQLRGKVEARGRKHVHGGENEHATEYVRHRKGGRTREIAEGGQGVQAREDVPVPAKEGARAREGARAKVANEPLPMAAGHHPPSPPTSTTARLNSTYIRSGLLPQARDHTRSVSIMSRPPPTSLPAPPAPASTTRPYSTRRDAEELAQNRAYASIARPATASSTQRLRLSASPRSTVPTRPISLASHTRAVTNTRAPSPTHAVSSHARQTRATGQPTSKFAPASVRTSHPYPPQPRTATLSHRGRLSNQSHSTAPRPSGSSAALAAHHAPTRSSTHDVHPSLQTFRDREPSSATPHVVQSPARFPGHPNVSLTKARRPADLILPAVSPPSPVRMTSVCPSVDDHSGAARQFDQPDIEGSAGARQGKRYSYTSLDIPPQSPSFADALTFASARCWRMIKALFCC